MKKIIIKILLISLITISIMFQMSVQASSKVQLGDINEDGVVDSKDLLLMVKHIAGTNNKEHSNWMLEGKEYEIADITKNGLVNGSDLLIMLRYISAKENPEEIGNQHPEWIEEIEKEDSIYEDVGEESNPRILIIGASNENNNKEDSNSEEIQLNKTELEMKVNEICKLDAKIGSGTTEKIEWETNNKEVVELYGEGMIVGKKAGEATITARVGSKTATCKVRVKEREIEISKIELDKRELELEVGEKGKIEVKIEPSTAQNTEVTYRVSNNEIAEVEKDGTVIGKNAGTTSVIARAGKKSAVCVIKVRLNEEKITEEVKETEKNTNTTQDDTVNNNTAKTTEVKEIKLDKKEITMQENQLRRLTAKIEPQEAGAGKEITWETSNGEVATVDSNGLVTGVKEGEAIITAKAGTKSTSCKIKVEKAKQAVLGLSLSTSNVEVEEGNTAKITASIAPKEASNRELNIKIDNEENATVEGESVTVDSEGKAEIEIRGIKEGEAVLTVTSGGIEKECRVTIKPKEIKAEQLTLSEKNVSIYKDQTVKVEVKSEPVKITEKITWKSANEKIATVDNEGKITAKNVGTTEVTARTESGLEGKCKVTVKIKPTNISLTTSSTEVESKKIKGLSALVTPSGAEVKEIEWTSNNPEKLAVERIIENGTYYIKSGLNDKKVLDVANGSTGNKAAIQIYDRNESDAQKFEITNVGGEYYTIKSKKSGKVIDVTNGGTKAGTKIQQYTSNGTDAQKWEFEYLGSGYYHIKSKASGLYLDVTNAKADNKNQLQIWTENKNKAQRFKLEQIDKKAPIVDNGTYYIKSSLNEKKVLDIANGSNENKAPVQLYEKNNTDAQKFEITSIGNNYYVIRARSSGKAIDVTNGGKKSGTKIQQYSYNSTDAQVWKIEKDGDYYKFKSKSSGLYLDVPEGKAENRKQLQIYTGNSSKAQKFKLEKESEDTKLANIEYLILKGKKEGKSTITAKLANGKTAKCTVNVKSSKITGSEAIAEAAVDLTCTVNPEPKIQGSYKGQRIYNSKTKKYIDTKERLLGNKKEFDGGDYASCAMSVAVVVRYSGVDKNFEYNTTVNQWPYLRKNWNCIGTYHGDNSILKPGDVLINSTHIFIYTGNKAVRKKYPKSNNDAFEAQWTACLYPCLFTVKTYSDQGYTIFRSKNYDKKIYDKILK